MTFSFVPIFLLSIIAQTGVIRNSPALDPVQAVVQGALDQVGITLYYDPAYVRLDYPGGDVPGERGVCTDVVVRAFRAAGVDLQQEIHEDMRRAFSKYPQNWGMKRPDPNIDHRRVANLMTFFTRQGKALPLSTESKDYEPGDVVAWRLPGGLLHTGIVVDRTVPGSRRPCVAHNIGAGARIEDVLFEFEIIGHYRYFPTHHDHS
jgi:hypothetical protein